MNPWPSDKPATPPIEVPRNTKLLFPQSLLPALTRHAEALRSRKEYPEVHPCAH